MGIGIVTLRLEGEKFIARVFPPLQSRPQSDTDERDGAMSEDDQKQMRKICREDEAVRDFGCAKNVDWNKPRDEEREADHAVAMLMRVVNG